MRIKEFLSRSPDLRNPNFDPAPFLIQLLKENNEEAMIERQN